MLSKRGEPNSIRSDIASGLSACPAFLGIILFRVVGSGRSRIYSFLFSIDNHNLTVIEVDGVEIEPYTVDTIEIDPGES